MADEKAHQLGKRLYSGSDIAVIVPTKDRPEKIRNLLESLERQAVAIGRIIFVDSGEDIGEVVNSFSRRLNVEYHRSSVQGQIYQRNLGISLLDDSTPLVCSLDDDIVVEPDAFKAIIDFWNRCAPETAGVSFAIANVPETKHSWLKGLMGMSSRKPGRVLRSGYNVGICHAEGKVKVQWLPGGATVWKRNILKQFANKAILSKWAICEDVIFSYPIGKKYPLYVCGDAKVRHEHVYDHVSKMKYWYYGKNATLWRFYFVESNPDLSRLLFLWMISWQVLGRCLKGLVLLRPQEIQYGFGQVEGAIIGIAAIYRGMDLITVLNGS